MAGPTFFVSIAAFCDPFLRFTIESAFARASEPEALVLGVIDQGVEALGSWLAEQPFADRVRYLHIDPLHSRGVCWARHLAQSLYDDEDWYLQVDSHTWFASGWDRVLRAHMDRLTRLAERPVLSIYPPGFEFDQDGQPVQKIGRIESVAYFTPKPDQVLNADNRVLTFRVAYHQLPLGAGSGEDWFYGHGFHLAGGFLFAPGRFVREVPYDPQFYFHGEEQGLALRAFTRGWALFTPQFHRVPLFHLYKMPASASPNLHWRQDLETRRSIKWPERRSRARKRFNDLVTGRLEPPYGLGEVRSLDDFAALSGIDYFGLEIRPPRVELVVAQPVAG
ncbi:MAG: GlcNAc-transferase family protein [Wenzhouxiangella sp.]